MSVSPTDGVEEANAAAGVPRAEPAAYPATPVERGRGVGAPAREAGVAEEADAVEVSAAGRDLAQEAMRDGRLGGVSESGGRMSRESLEEAVAASNYPAVRELFRTFAGYDNSRAVARFNRYLETFTAYGSAADLVRAAMAESDLASAERTASAAGAQGSNAAAALDGRDVMVRAVDRWLAADGVFVPPLLSYPSGDGFRFLPFTSEAEAALRFAEVFASGERDRMALYLEEMALLSPSNFLFYDPTGLGMLDLNQRRLFLNRIDELLEKLADQARPPEGIQPRAAELRYAFDESGRLDFARLGERGRESERSVREAIAADATGYAAEVVESLRQYGTQILAGA